MMLFSKAPELSELYTDVYTRFVELKRLRSLLFKIPSFIICCFVEQIKEVYKK